MLSTKLLVALKKRKGSRYIMRSGTACVFQIRLPAAIKAGKINQPKMHPAYDLDRRYTARPASTKPLFSHITEEYSTARGRSRHRSNVIACASCCNLEPRG
ncbi:hypothetical protein AGR1B_Lc10034 [Agrobacterium fabacearum S56]|nr:hypothetical protein AGR1B_Lc10034 [Agrobacterium fabacearum S56]